MSSTNQSHLAHFKRVIEIPLKPAETSRAQWVLELHSQVEALRVAGQHVFHSIHYQAEHNAYWEQLEHALERIGCELEPTKAQTVDKMFNQLENEIALARIEAADNKGFLSLKTRVALGSKIQLVKDINHCTRYPND